MVHTIDLWLPILVSAAAVFIASSVLYMVLPHHKSDWKKLPDEEAVRQALNRQPAGPGVYMIPYCTDMKQASEEAFAKKADEGPVGILTLRRPGRMQMGLPLTLCVVYNLAVSVVVAHLLSQAPPASGGGRSAIFHSAAIATLLAYAGALIYPAIWKGIPWPNVLKEALDALVYAVLTGLVFAWLWPMSS